MPFARLFFVRNGREKLFSQLFKKKNCLRTLFCSVPVQNLSSVRKLKIWHFVAINQKFVRFVFVRLFFFNFFCAFSCNVFCVSERTRCRRPDACRRSLATLGRLMPKILGTFRQNLCACVEYPKDCVLHRDNPFGIQARINLLSLAHNKQIYICQNISCWVGTGCSLNILFFLKFFFNFLNSASSAAALESGIFKNHRKKTQYLMNTLQQTDMTVHRKDKLSKNEHPVFETKVKEPVYWV